MVYLLIPIFVNGDNDHGYDVDNDDDIHDISFLHVFICLYSFVHQHSHLVDGIGDDDGVVDDDDDHGDDVDHGDDIHDISFLHVFVCLYSFVHQHSHGVDGIGVQLSC